jgi:chemotaxis protein MotB
MARKPKHEEHENHERWLVSYADFITLLFAFFVVMYAISSVNEGKYRVLSSSLVRAFSHPKKTIEPIQYGTPLRAPIVQHDAMDSKEDTVNRSGVDHQIMPTPGEIAEMQKLADQIAYNLKDLIDKELIAVKKTNLGLEIEIKSNVLFASGVAKLSQQAVLPLKKIAAILSKTPNDINVEGYTDNVPISTPSFPSNWELSAARAASVVRLFTQSDVDPVRLKAIGFGEYHPIADNATEQGRNKNRRVTIMVLNKADAKRVNLSLDRGLDSKAKSAGGANPGIKIIDTHFSTPESKAGSVRGNDSGDDKLLLPPTPSAIITLPLDESKQTVPLTRITLDPPATVSSAQNTKTQADNSGGAKTVKPMEPVNLPVLQLLPKSKGVQR